MDSATKEMIVAIELMGFSIIFLSVNREAAVIFVFVLHTIYSPRGA